MKLLYAASNNPNSKIQLSRFLNAVQEIPNLHIKIAAYKNSSPTGINIDWTLDCLLNIYKPDLISTHNDNLSIYYDQVKNYAPDLIISDLEYFTSYIANLLDITLWQCSSSIINFALTKQEKYNLGLFKHYAYVLNRDPLHTQRTVNLIDNSNCNFVYSHFGDTDNPPSLQSNFEWIRPYHQLGKESIPCQHYLVAALSGYNKKILESLQKYSDSVAFTDFKYEQYQNLVLKDIGQDQEYFCNLKSSTLFACEGQTSFLADAFYNNKHALIYPDYENHESIINSQLSQKLNLGTIVSYDDNLSEHEGKSINNGYHSSKFLHEKIEEVI